MRGPVAVMGAALMTIAACTVSGAPTAQTSSRPQRSAARITSTTISTTPTPTAASSVSMLPRGPTRRITSTPYKMAFSIPASWRVTPYSGLDRVDYDGSTGWLDLGATSTAGTTLDSTCQREATNNVLHPFGTAPTIQLRMIDGRPGCVIHPSADGLVMPRRKGGPSFASAAAIVCYRTPITFPNTGTDRWGCLIIEADPAHITAIADSAVLLQ